MKGMNMRNYWQNWLSAWSAAVVIFGVVLAGGAFEATDGLLRALLTLFSNPLPDVMDAHHRFGFGLMGAVSLGWGLTFYGAFKALHALDAKTAAPIWRFMNIGIFAWYLIDSYISVATGFWMNAVSNTLLVIAYYIPVLKSGVLRG
jgi:hypothetical protein